MTSQKDAKSIAEQLCQHARANYVAEGAAFNEYTPLAEAGIDSFALVELLLYCERIIGVRVPESHLTPRNLASLDTLARCLADLARRRPSSPPVTG